MTIHEATEIVARAALAQANGSVNATEILEAAVMVRAYMRDQDEPEITVIVPETSIDVQTR